MKQMFIIFGGRGVGGGLGGGVWIWISFLTLALSRQLVQQMGCEHWQAQRRAKVKDDLGRTVGGHAHDNLSTRVTCLCLPFFLAWPSALPPPHAPLQSPTGSVQCLVMKGLSNGSFLYPGPAKLVWQLFPLPRLGSILSLSGSEYILSEWISLKSLLCVCMRVCFLSHMRLCQLDMD